MSNFKARLTEPSTSNKYWIHTSKGGVNECILITGNSCLPNCVGYTWGRFYEASGKRPKLSRANAENWYSYNDGYERGKTPKLGAVICWSKGKVGNGNDGAGHVAFVEEVYDDESILVSASDYGGRRFYTRKYNKPYSMNEYTFQGFIYNPDVKETEKPKLKYKIGDVVSINGVYISSDSDNMRKPSITKGKITKIIEGAKNPYLLEDGYIGWINEGCIEKIDTEKIYHIVKKGDSLWDIAHKYYGSGLKYPKIKELNNLTSDMIYPGQKLRIK